MWWAAETSVKYERNVRLVADIWAMVKNQKNNEAEEIWLMTPFMSQH